MAEPDLWVGPSRGECVTLGSEPRDPAAISTPGVTGTDREHPGLRESLAACRVGHTRVGSKLDRPARSLTDARAIAGRPRCARSLSTDGSGVPPSRTTSCRCLSGSSSLVARRGRCSRFWRRPGAHLAALPTSSCRSAHRRRPSPGLSRQAEWSGSRTIQIQLADEPLGRDQLADDSMAARYIRQTARMDITTSPSSAGVRRRSLSCGRSGTAATADRSRACSSELSL